LLVVCKNKCLGGFNECSWWPNFCFLQC
jgi:hypothetical protein